MNAVLFLHLVLTQLHSLLIIAVENNGLVSIRDFSKTLPPKSIGIILLKKPA